LYLAYVRYDWAYTYPFLRPAHAYAQRDPSSSGRGSWNRTRYVITHYLPSFLCLMAALILALVEGILLVVWTGRRRRGRRR